MAQEEKKTMLGLIASGLVMAKNCFVPNDGKPPRFSFDIAIPGIREMLTISVKKEVYETVNEMQEWKALIKYRTYKGVVYFEAI